MFRDLLVANRRISGNNAGGCDNGDGEAWHVSKTIGGALLPVLLRFVPAATAQHHFFFCHRDLVNRIDTRTLWLQAVIVCCYFLCLPAQHLSSILRVAVALPCACLLRRAIY